MLIKIDKEGYTVKKYLAEKGYSRRQISRLAKTLTINNEKAYLTSTLKTNDELRFNLVGQDEGKRLENIEIKYQNQDLIIVNKPAGIVAHSDNKHQENKVQKTYLLVCEGKLDQNEGLIEIHIKKDYKKFIVAKDGKKSITKYKFIKGNEKHSLYEVHIITGRSHQIRLSFAHLKHPIVGDVLYGSKNNTINRIDLHAYSLTFDDIEIKQELPTQLKELIHE